MSSVIAWGGRAQLAQKRSAIAAIIRATSIFVVRQAHHEGRVLEPRHGRLRAQRLAALRQPPHRHLEHRVRAQAVAIVGVLVARRDQEHPPPQHLDHLMVDARAIAPVDKAARQPLGETEASFHIAQHQDAAVRRPRAAVERHAHLLAANGWQGERQKVIVMHGGCGAPRPRY